MPWLLRFLRQTTPARTRANAAALARLLEHALDAYQPLIEDANAGDLVRHDGSLYLFRSESSFRSARTDIRLREQLGVAQDVVDRDDVAKLEPGLAPVYARGLLFPDARHLVDPSEFVRRLARAVEARGGQITRGEVRSLHPTTTGVRVQGREVQAEAGTAVIAAGAWSGRLTRQLGERVPLDTERGYHVEYAMDSPPLARPVCAVENGCYLTPMRARLRVAGTIELGGLGAPPNPRRLRLLDDVARRLLPALGRPTSEWLGFRPSLPDSLPVIGRPPRTRNVIYAFGHGHLGLTLAGITGQLVSELLAGRSDPSVLAPFSAARFGSGAVGHA